MDAIDILGSLLGGKSSGGLGGKILKDMMGRSAPSPAPKQQPSPSSRVPSGSRSGGSGSSSLGGSLSGSSIDASDLEDLLNVARNRPSAQEPTRTSTPTRAPTPPAAPTRPSSPTSTSSPNSPFSNSPQTRPDVFSTGTSSSNNPFDPPVENSERQSQLAWVLIRAMLNAAKSDGQITTDEQQAILQKMGI